MTERNTDLTTRRAELLERIAAQRAQVKQIGAELQAPFAVADQGIDAFRFLRRHPLLVAGVVGYLLIRRRGTSGMLASLWGVWQGYRHFAALSDRVLTRN